MGSAYLEDIIIHILMMDRYFLRFVATLMSPVMNSAQRH